MRLLNIILKYLLSVFFVLAGLNHFINPALYLKIMPPFLPLPLLLVYLSGFFEMILGGMLLVAALTHVAAVGLILLLIAVFPANIHMAINPQLFPDINPVVLWLRLPLQAVFIAWAYWFARPASRQE